MSNARILLLDNEAGLCRMMSAVLADHGYQPYAYTEPQQALNDFAPGSYDLVVTDIKMPHIDGLEVLQHINKLQPDLPVIIITAYATVELSIQALRHGAYDMLTKPFEPEELLYRVRNALQHTQLVAENRDLKEQLAADRFDASSIIGADNGLKAIMATVRKVAGRDTSVLITGESGTGKELIAQALHANSHRHNKPFQALNCGALPESLLAGELFGHRKGAFTGATQDRKGLLEAADGGTLFLDEVGNLPLEVQKTLLRFLQEQQFTRLGDHKPLQVNVRLISATNADLAAEVAAGSFRDDLYYRLNVVHLHLPPLRERLQDVPLLISHFLQHINTKLGTHIQGLTPEALQLLTAHNWPGNIRQLQNTLEACAAISESSRIEAADIMHVLGLGNAHAIPEDQTLTEACPLEYEAALGLFEKEYLQRLLQASNGDMEYAAQLAGMNMATIYRKLKKYNLRKEDLL